MLHDLDDDAAAIAAMAAAGVPASPAPRKRLNLLSVAGLLALPERGYLLKGVMAPGELSVWWGPPKSGKSFLALHVAYALAQGRSIFGRRVRQCRVLYLACEGRTGLRARMEALVTRYGQADGLLVLAQPLDLWSPGGDTEALRATIDEHKPDLLVVDTVNRVMAGGDENSSADMGALIRHVDALRAGDGTDRPGPHVALIHHGTKAGGAGPRGHGSLLGAVDASIEVTVEEDGTRLARLDAMKDDPRSSLAFRLKVVDVGVDEDGDKRTTCVIAEIEQTEARPSAPKLTPTEEAWLSDLREMFESGWAKELEPIALGGTFLTLTRDHVREELRVRGRFALDPNGNLTSTDRERLHRNLNGLKNKGRIGLSAEYVWLL